MKKLWNHAIEMKKKYVLRKEKVYPLSRKGKEKIYKFIEEQLEKRYIRLSKLSQIELVFFVRKKDCQNQR